MMGGGGVAETMQILVSIDSDAVSYVRAQLHRAVRAPQICPNCQQGRTLEAHGYYERWVTASAGEAVRIRVRRFFAGIAQ